MNRCSQVYGALCIFDCRAMEVPYLKSSSRMGIRDIPQKGLQRPPLNPDQTGSLHSHNFQYAGVNPLIERSKLQILRGESPRSANCPYSGR